MRIALAINLVLLVAGVAGALLFDSVALLADAGHVLSDVGAIAIGLFAAAMAARPPDQRRTFGFQRGEILAALVNGLTLVAVAVLVIVEAIRRLSDPPDVDGHRRPGRRRDRAAGQRRRDASPWPAATART